MKQSDNQSNLLNNKTTSEFIVLGIGQCGIQIAAKLNFNAVINIDSELKTLSSIKHPNLCLSKGGRGNNWASGYYSKDSFKTEIISQFYPNAKGFILIHSIAGGTGSGFGSRLCQMLRNDFPKCFIISVPIVPFQSGETSLQHYNSILTLSWMSKFSDQIILFKNDQILHSLQHTKKYSTPKKLTQNSPTVTIDEINDVIAKALMHTFNPIYPIETCLKRNFDCWKFIETVCPLPTLKFSTLHSQTEIDQTWSTTLSPPTPHLTTHLLTRAPLSHHTFSPTFQKLIKTHFQNKPSLASHYIQSIDVNEKETVLSLCVNGGKTDVCVMIRDIIEKAERMRNAGAYLHWYERFDNGFFLDDGDYSEGVDCLTDVLDCYEFY